MKDRRRSPGSIAGEKSSLEIGSNDGIGEGVI